MTFILIIGIIVVIVFVVLPIIGGISEHRERKEKQRERQKALHIAITSLPKLDSQVLLSVYKDIKKEERRMISKPTNKALILFPISEDRCFLDLNNDDYFTFSRALEAEIRRRKLIY